MYIFTVLELWHDNVLMFRLLGSQPGELRLCVRQQQREDFTGIWPNGINGLDGLVSLWRSCGGLRNKLRLVHNQLKVPCYLSSWWDNRVADSTRLSCTGNVSDDDLVISGHTKTFTLMRVYLKVFVKRMFQLPMGHSPLCGSINFSSDLTISPAAKYRYRVLSVVTTQWDHQEHGPQNGEIKILLKFYIGGRFIRWGNPSSRLRSTWNPLLDFHNQNGVQQMYLLSYPVIIF